MIFLLLQKKVGHFFFIQKNENMEVWEKITKAKKASIGKERPRGIL